MSLVSPVDPSLERTSACPVHFLWDARGHGRVWVRLGFLGLVGAGALASASALMRLPALAQAGALVAATSGLAWLAGHAVSLVERRRRRTSRLT